MLLETEGLGVGTRLDGLDFTLGEGELLVLLGENGAGKSTLLECLAGWLVPEQGQIRFHGRALEHWSVGELARRRALLSQQPQMPFGLTAWEVLELAGIPLGLKGAALEQALLDMAGRLDIGQLLERPINRLSGGEQQRVQLARTLLQIWPDLNPEGSLLLLDEPLTGLDLRHVLLLMQLLKALVAGGLTVVLSLHDINLASQYADRVLLLKQGRQVCLASPREALSEERLGEVFNVHASLEQSGSSQWYRFGL